MPANYVLLEKITVGAAGASSVTFSGIPQTGYTDLVIKASTRGTRAQTETEMRLTVNGSATSYSNRAIQGNGSSASSFTYSTTFFYNGETDAASATASTFGNAEIYIPNYTSSNFKSISTDAVSENNATGGAYTNMVAGLWSNTSPITSMTLTPGANNWAQGSTFYLYGVAKLGTTPAIVPYATGGDTIMTDGTYWYHTFLSSGTFTPAKAITCDYLVVAGGGGGGGNTGGGGGAGGYRTSIGGSALSLGTSAVTVTVGAGGAGGSGSTPARGSNGSNSVFSTITSNGGGGGGATGTNQGLDGGSGGGSARGAQSPGVSGGLGNTPSTSPNQGNNGGNNGSTGSSGGGGGAGAVGGNVSGVNPGAGGAGSSNSISGSSVTYAGGGGGGTYETSSGGAGGSGGGGAGAADLQTPGAGTANRGGGGGGGNNSNSPSGSTTGGAGGSGIVIVRYAV
jgi:hypothetical protein